MLASTRPQLGSLPKTAALNRLLRATERATSTASSSVAALSAVIAISWSAPSASLSSCMARSVQAWVSASVKSAGDGVIPLAPLASTVTVSLVDMQPSESSRSKLTRVAARRASSSSAAGTTASVVMTTSMVASCGASMPAPLAIPPMLQPAPSTMHLLAHRVGGHDRLGGVLPAVGGQGGVRGVDAGQHRSRGLARPIRPVEQTTTSIGADAERLRRPAPRPRGWSGSRRRRCSSWRHRS